MKEDKKKKEEDKKGAGPQAVWERLTLPQPLDVNVLLQKNGQEVTELNRMYDLNIAKEVGDRLLSLVAKKTPNLTAKPSQTGVFLNGHTLLTQLLKDPDQDLVGRLLLTLAEIGLKEVTERLQQNPAFIFKLFLLVSLRDAPHHGPGSAELKTFLEELPGTQSPKAADPGKTP